MCKTHTCAESHWKKLWNRSQCTAVFFTFQEKGSEPNSCFLSVFLFSVCIMFIRDNATWHLGLFQIYMYTTRKPMIFVTTRHAQSYRNFNMLTNSETVAVSAEFIRSPFLRKKEHIFLETRLEEPGFSYLMKWLPHCVHQMQNFTSHEQTFSRLESQSNPGPFWPHCVLSHPPCTSPFVSRHVTGSRCRAFIWLHTLQQVDFLWCMSSAVTFCLQGEWVETWRSDLHVDTKGEHRGAQESCTSQIVALFKILACFVRHCHWKLSRLYLSLSFQSLWTSDSQT